MKVLVDTSVWSLILRKKFKPLTHRENNVKSIFIEFIEASRVQLIGPIRQEILSGINEISTFKKLRDHLTPFDDIKIITEDYETAADFFNICMKKGIQGSHIDFLICAIAYNHNLPIFTLDIDFSNYSKCIDIRLIKIPD
ncbi:MAG: PIN domain-containing protein [Spirochaetia bacterium]|nr:PIN domain-containing protein [Spirochaetia bacterium]